jgi:hypothetical protein
MEKEKLIIGTFVQIRLIKEVGMILDYVVDESDIGTLKYSVRLPDLSIEDFYDFELEGVTA